jgi:hypothetical protein
MKLSIKKEVTREVEINPPMFWKQDISRHPVYVAFIDKKTIIRLFVHGDYMTLAYGGEDDMKYFIKEANQDYLLCDESEFLRVYSEALEAIRLQPKEFTVNNCMDHEAHNNLKQQISY